jgi:hypothetical protein
MERQEELRAGSLRWNREKARRCGGSGGWPPSKPRPSRPAGTIPWWRYSFRSSLWRRVCCTSIILRTKASTSWKER